VIIEVEHLIKRYTSATDNAVDDISFTVEAGEFFSLLGPNGAGKTTTLSILTTTLSPTSGRVIVAGEDVLKAPGNVRRNSGIIFQNRSLDENLTAEENIRLHAILYGMYDFRPTFTTMPRDYKQRVHHLAGLLGIDSEIFNPIKSFSGGMKRKLEIVRGLIHEPQVLFLDEPSTGLDPESRRNLWQYLTDVRVSKGVTIFLTTHYLEEAEGADKICIINKGRIVSIGTPSQIKTDLAHDHLIIDAENRSQLRAELKELGVPFIEAPQFKVALNDCTAHQIIKSINTPLNLVRTNAPSLEDAYLRIVAGRPWN
jgi:ABC-2 type transport system ATP-binding protein